MNAGSADDLDACGSLDVDHGLALGVLEGPDLDLALGGGVGALGPIQPGQVGLDLVLTGGQVLHAQDVVGQVGAGTGGPAVAEGMTELDVAIVAVVAVDVHLALGDHLVDAAGVLHPVKIEVLPEGGGAHIQHTAPVLLHIAQSACVVACHGFGGHDVVAHEGGVAVAAAGDHDPLVDLDGVGKPCQHHEGVGLLGGGGGGLVALHLLGGGLAEGGGLVLAQLAEQVSAVVQRQLQKALKAHVLGHGIIVGGPVQETALGEGLAAVLVHEGGQQGQQAPEVVSLLLQVGLVTEGAVPIAVDQEPPDGVGRDAVHPRAHGGLIADHVQGAGDDLVVAEGGQDGVDLGVHITDPDQTVALDAVPQVLLHIDVGGVGGGVPDAGQLLVGAFEGALVVQIQIVEHTLDGLEGHHGVIVDQLHADEPLARLVGLVGGVEAHIHDAIADGVIVGGVLDLDGGDGLHDRLTGTDDDVTAGVVAAALGARAPDHEADGAGELTAVVQHQLGLGLTGDVPHGAALAHAQGDLVAPLLKQGLGVIHVALGQHHPLGGDVAAGTGVGDGPVQSGDLFVDLHGRFSYLNQKFSSTMRMIRRHIYYIMLYGFLQDGFGILWIFYHGKSPPLG